MVLGLLCGAIAIKAGMSGASKAADVRIASASISP
jgi:hypothetical protein